MAHGWEAGSLFDLLGDGVAREILALTDAESRSADDLAEHCAASGPTVYRRLDALCEHDALAESVAYDEDGNHYRTYECRLEEVRVRVDGGSVALDVRFDDGREGARAGRNGDDGNRDDDENRDERPD
ncbi:ArsR family transcriptional regulator [Halobium salinum]|uniref:ArsR family transcriptional regulator n=1 Tax=Halobium salinum TaxID=1364940 RepID=A0ABD5P8G6_9EURY|nr:transcriptional regulator [Halobium salinum]